MAYGEIKVDTITFTDGGIDKSVSISGLVQNPTFSGNITVTGTISGNTLQGQTVSGVTVTGATAAFTTGTFISLTGTTTQGTTATYTTGSFTSLTGTTTTGTTATFASGVFTTQISGATITGNAAAFTTVTGGVATITSGVFASGIAAAPSVSVGTTNNGLYSPGTNQVALSTNGTGRLFVDGSGQVNVASENVSGDDNIGNLYIRTTDAQAADVGGKLTLGGSYGTGGHYAFAGIAGRKENSTNNNVAGYLQFLTSTVGGTLRELMRLNSSGNLGIGDSAPGSKLTVKDTTVGGTPVQIIGANNFTYNLRSLSDGSSDGRRFDINIGSGSGQISLSNSAAEFMRLTPTGVGIGTTTVNADLHVYDSDGDAEIRITSNSSNQAILRFGNTVDQTLGSIRFDSPTDSLQFYGLNDAERMRITSTGQLSHIGAGSAGSPAVIFNGSAPSNSLVITSAGLVGIGTSSPEESLHNNGINGRLILSAGNAPSSGATSNKWRFALREVNEGDFYVQHYNGSSYDSAVTVTSAGRVGIGTTSPEQPLHIKNAGSSACRLVLENTGSSSAQSTQVWSQNNDLVFDTSGSSKVRITSAGLVGIGTSSPAAILHTVNAESGILGANIVGNIYIESSTTAASGVGGGIAFGGAYDGTTTTVGAGIKAAKSNGTPGDYGFDLSFFTRANSTAGTERMRITGTGNVGIGTTSPGSELDVRAANGASVVAGRINNAGTNSEPGYFRVRGPNASGVEKTWLEMFPIVNDATNGSEDASFVLRTIKGGSVTDSLRIDSSGRLLVGTASARTALAPDIAPKLQVEDTIYSRSAISIVNNEANNRSGFFVFGKSRGSTLGSTTSVVADDRLGAIRFAGADGADLESQAAAIECYVDGTPGANDMPGRLVFSTTADGASSPTARMTIKEDGVVAVGASDSPNGEVLFASAPTGAVAAGAYRVAPTTGTYSAVVFYDGANTDCGSIDVNTTANTTAYTTSSDYRLKDNVQPLTGSLQRLSQLKPCKWEWLSAPGVAGEGFIAHEAQEVVPEAVTGTKDEVDENGDPVYQGIDQSKLVPLLTAALQEAIGEIKSLKARVAALEGA